MYQYQRIANDLSARIRTGVLKPGAFVAAETVTAKRYGVCPTKVRRAYRMVLAAGLIQKVAGRGHRVARENAPDASLARYLVPDDLWSFIEPLIPQPPISGKGRLDNREMFAAIVFVLTSGCAWRSVPPTFDVAMPTIYRRFREWHDAGLWQRIHDDVSAAVTDLRIVQWSRDVSRAADDRRKNPGNASGIEVS